jgi:cytochrome c-type biogenesis protein CcmF
MADIYLAPVIEREHGEELQLGKGEKTSVQGLDVKFVRFAMGDSNPDGNITVYGLLEVSKDGVVQEVKPELVVPRNGPMVPVPVKAFDRYEILLTSVNMNERLANITVHDLLDIPKPEKIEAEISRKPLMNMVWLGTILVTFGTGWAAFKRNRHTA